VTAGSRLRMYGGLDSECRYELIRCTKVDFPAPAIPIVIMAMGFFFSGLLELDELIFGGF